MGWATQVCTLEPFLKTPIRQLEALAHTLSIFQNISSQALTVQRCDQAIMGACLQITKAFWN